MGITLKLNERSWAIQIIQEITNYVSGLPDFLIKRAGGETTINTGKKVMFPDVLLFADNGMSKILQGWELKMPDVPIDNKEFIEDSWRKARNLGLSSTVIWNFRYAVLYVLNSATDKFEIAKKWDNSKIITEDRNDVELHKNIWLTTLFEVVDEVNRFLHSGFFKPSTQSNVIVNNYMESFIKQNKDLEADYLREISKRDSVFSCYIDLWWDSARSEYINDENDCYTAYAKVLLLDWLNKFTFANILRSRFPTAEKVTNIKDGTTPIDAIHIFEEITQKCDFFSVFHKIDYQEHIHELIWNQIIEINLFLSSSKMDFVDQQDMQNFLENSVKVSQRVIIGQYTTDPRLADFLVRISVKDATGNCFDPCCGTGTFPRALLNYKIEKRIELEEAYQTVFAEDRQSFPLQIAGISTASKNSINLPAIIFKKNIFELNIGDKISIVNPQNGELIRIEVPAFDTIVSNLPFIDFCRNNTRDQSDVSAKEAITNRIYEMTQIKLSKRSDYFMYIIFKLWELLKLGGTACVITSNSWTATSAGNHFLNALIKYFKISAIIQSGNGRWFKNAEIVTTVFCLEKKNISEPVEEDHINFYLLNASLSDLENRQILNKAVGTILLGNEIDPSVVKKENCTVSDLNSYLSLNISLNAVFHGIDWLFSFKKKLVRIDTLFTVFRGAKTGQDSIFIPETPDVVDEDYVCPMLKNSKNCSRMVAEPDNVFVTSNKTYEELEQLGHTKTVNYFKQFENNLNQSVLQHGDIWYYLSDASKKASIITSLNPDRRLFFAKFEKPTCINQRLIGFIPKDAVTDLDLCHMLLNSIIGLFYIEASGFPRGAGALDLSKDKVKLSFMLNPALLSEHQIASIKASFIPLLQRDVKSLFEELEEDDRKNFDLTVLRCYGLETFYENIKKSLVSLLKVRLSQKN